MATEAEHLARAQEHCVAAAKLITDAAAASVADHSLTPEGRIAMVMLAQILAGSFDDGLLAVFERLKTIDALSFYRLGASIELRAAARLFEPNSSPYELYNALANLVHGLYDDAICRLIRGGKDLEP